MIMELNTTEHRLWSPAREEWVTLPSTDDPRTPSVAAALAERGDREVIAKVLQLKRQLCSIQGLSLHSHGHRPRGWDLLRLSVKLFGLPFFSDRYKHMYVTGVGGLCMCLCLCVWCVARGVCVWRVACACSVCSVC